MANTLTRQTGTASITGSTIFTVPSGSTVTIVGLRAVNTDNIDNHWVTVEVGGFNISGVETPLPVGSGYEFTEGAKIIATEGDTVIAYADDDNVVELYVSYLEQS